MDKKPEYKGPSELTSALGQSQLDSWTGSLAGAAGGAVVGALMHNKEKNQTVKKAFGIKRKGAIQRQMTDVGEGWKLGKDGLLNEETIEAAELTIEKSGGLKGL